MSDAGSAYFDFSEKGRLKGGCSQDWLPHKEIADLLLHGRMCPGQTGA
jgi:hypothetical protein